jgi:hypothetical protein
MEEEECPALTILVVARDFVLRRHAKGYKPIAPYPTADDLVFPAKEVDMLLGNGFLKMSPDGIVNLSANGADLLSVVENEMRLPNKLHSETS